MINVDPDKIVCPHLPGNYSVHCNNRSLRVFWIPPQDESGNFIRAVPTFREVGPNISALLAFKEFYLIIAFISRMQNCLMISKIWKKYLKSLVHGYSIS